MRSGLPVLLALGGLLVLSSSAASGCGKDSHHVTLRFRALVSGRPFAPGADFSVGQDGAQVSFSDLRMFVSRVYLRREDGTRDKVELISDGRHQDSSVVLVDFGGRAAEGPRTPHTSVPAKARAARHVAVEFDVGLPFSQNHQDASRAAPPFDVTGMFWVWRDGYKFFRLDGESFADAPRKLSVHIGSTGCKGQGSAPVDPAITCAQENRSTIILEGFDPQKHTIDLDIDALLSGLSLRGEHGSDGCESAPDDPDCQVVLASMGLIPGTKQRVFKVGRP